MVGNDIDPLHGVVRERKPDPEKKGTAVLVRLNSVEELTGNVIMARD